MEAKKVIELGSWDLTKQRSLTINTDIYLNLQLRGQSPIHIVIDTDDKEYRYLLSQYGYFYFYADEGNQEIIIKLYPVNFNLSKFKNKEVNRGYLNINYWQ